MRIPKRDIGIISGILFPTRENKKNLEVCAQSEISGCRGHLCHWILGLNLEQPHHIPFSPWVCTAQVPNRLGISCGEFCNGKSSLLPPSWMQIGSTLNPVQNSRNGLCWDGKKQEEKGNCCCDAMECSNRSLAFRHWDQPS